MGAWIKKLTAKTKSNVPRMHCYLGCSNRRREGGRLEESCEVNPLSGVGVGKMPCCPVPSLSALLLERLRLARASGGVPFPGCIELNSLTRSGPALCCAVCSTAGLVSASEAEGYSTCKCGATSVSTRPYRSMRGTIRQESSASRRVVSAAGIAPVPKCVAPVLSPGTNDSQGMPPAIPGFPLALCTAVGVLSYRAGSSRKLCNDT